MFYEQEVCERRSKAEKSLLEIEDSKMFKTLPTLRFNCKAIEDFCTVQRTGGEEAENIRLLYDCTRDDVKNTPNLQGRLFFFLPI